jgi:hypothetical protein
LALYFWIWRLVVNGISAGNIIRKKGERKEKEELTSNNVLVNRLGFDLAQKSRSNNIDNQKE